MIMTPVSIGEVLDKISILEIKSKRISDVEKLENIRAELDSLLVVAKEYRYPALESELKKVNESLWEIEDRIRVKERFQEFDNEFINLARSVYITNDQRADIKRKINIISCSDLIEEKGYEDMNDTTALVNKR